jgi:hypothetical protein
LSDSTSRSIPPHLRIFCTVNITNVHVLHNTIETVTASRGGDNVSKSNITLSEIQSRRFPYSLSAVIGDTNVELNTKRRVRGRSASIFSPCGLEVPLLFYFLISSTNYFLPKMAANMRGLTQVRTSKAMLTV